MILTDQFEIEIDGVVAIVEVTAGYTTEVDKYYGADADGNRGLERTEIILEWVRIYDTDGKNLTQILKEKHPSEFTRIMEWARNDLSERTRGGIDEAHK